jgi:hypothetical protein
VSGPELVGLALGDPSERWAALGFDVEDSRLCLGGVVLKLDAGGEGILAWRLRGVDPEAEIDGLAAIGADLESTPADHPNGAVGIDHVVVATPDFDRTAVALEQAGIGLRRVRDAGGFRQGFRRLGPAILELVEARHGAGGPSSAGDAAGAAPARFWGLVVIVEDLQALAERLGERLGKIRPAVQPGRQIATLRDAAGLSTKVAFMDPE